MGKIWPGNAIVFEIGKFWVITECLILVPVGKIHGKRHRGLMLKRKTSYEINQNLHICYDAQNWNGTDLLIIYYYYYCSVASDDSANSQEDIAVL